MKKIAVLVLFIAGAFLWVLNYQSNQLETSSKTVSKVALSQLENVEMEEDSKAFDFSKIDFPSIFSALINTLK